MTEPQRHEPPLDQRTDIVLQHHLQGHFGIKATVDAIREAGFDWPGINADTKKICATCVPCLRHNIAKRGYHPLQPIAASQPFDHVAVDLAGPLPTSHRGNNYLVLLVDIHTRFVCLRAVQDKRMQTISMSLFEIFTAFGFPKIIQSDNGTEFVNEAMKEMFIGAKIDHRLVTPYHPRANGVAERHVQTAISTIKKQIDGAQKDWDLSVPFVQFAMNTKVSAMHNSSPFAVLFGRTPNQFADYADYATIVDASGTADDDEARIHFMQEVVFPGIADRARETQNAMKSSYDATHHQVDIPTGSYVMVREERRRRKLDPRFEGPFKVIGKSGKTYTLEDNSGALLPHRYPPSALKLISSDPFFESDSYAVEAIINHRQTDHGGYEYLVRWKNFSKLHDTWEPSSSFDDEQTITSYWNRRAGPAGKSLSEGG
jgi:Chromo (CHRromatin Organisation MOdifier) domain/Integrase zinc binding domain/Integrase core domain